MKHLYEKNHPPQIRFVVITTCMILTNNNPQYVNVFMILIVLLNIEPNVSLSLHVDENNRLHTNFDMKIDGAFNTPLYWLARYRYSRNNIPSLPPQG